jgi:hypothetical protein
MRARLSIAAVLVLLAGLSVALGIYFAAGESATGTLDAVYGSKPYVRHIQQFGGKASVLFDDFMRWFASLWEGRRLAYTVGWLSALASAVLFLAARSFPERD